MTAYEIWMAAAFARAEKGIFSGNPWSNPDYIFDTDIRMWRLSTSYLDDCPF